MSFGIETQRSVERGTPESVAEATSLHALLRALKLHDPYTAGHSGRVASYAGVVASVLGLSRRQTEIVRRAGLAHDVGKLAVPHYILAKNVRLASVEFDQIRSHPAFGGRLVERIPSTRDLAKIVRHHHEHWDGRGYPDGLSGSAIPLESRLILVVDAFDAMTTARPYDPMISAGAAMKEIVHCSGQQFDPLVVEAMQHAFDENLLRAAELAPAILM
ncbi:MAG: polar amino acid transport system substrate-binding protein [Actinomycetota bacterium]|nr:polar amino acid transport system substrate-binding protein [Actinomycetota bacterium]